MKGDISFILLLETGKGFAWVPVSGQDGEMASLAVRCEVWFPTNREPVSRR